MFLNNSFMLLEYSFLRRHSCQQWKIILQIVNENRPFSVNGLNPGVISKVGWVWLSRVNVVLNRTVVVDSDWRFDNLCGSHLQSQSELYHVSWWYYPLVIDLIGQLCRDVFGRLSVKPWCYWLWRLIISDWCVSIRLLSQLNSRLLLVKLLVLQLFSRS